MKDLKGLEKKTCKRCKKSVLRREKKTFQERDQSTSTMVGENIAFPEDLSV